MCAGALPRSGRRLIGRLVPGRRLVLTPADCSVPWPPRPARPWLARWRPPAGRSTSTCAACARPWMWPPVGCSTAGGAGHGGGYGPGCWSSGNGLGDLPRFAGDRRRYAGQPAPDCCARGPGADHDCCRFGCGDSGRTGLQPAGALDCAYRIAARGLCLRCTCPASWPGCGLIPQWRSVDSPAPCRPLQWARSI